MPLIGSGSLKISKTATMDECLVAILKPFNSSQTLIQQKINEINGVRSRGDYDIIKDLNGTYDKLGYQNPDEDDEATELLVSTMKKGFVIKNIMSLLSRVPSYRDKVVCLIYLITEAQLLTSNAADFHLTENFETDFVYILEDNKFINKVIDEIHDEILQLDDKLGNIKAKFKSEVDEDVASEILSYPSETYVSMSTSDFFRAVKRKVGERYTKEVQNSISNFLKSYKKAIKAATRGSVKSYCQKFRMDPNSYNQDNIMKAMKPIDDLDIWS